MCVIGLKSFCVWDEFVQSCAFVGISKFCSMKICGDEGPILFRTPAAGGPKAV